MSTPIKTDVIVIGAGLFGSAIATHLSKRFEVTVIDSEDPLSASKCSFGVWKEGWVNDTIKPYVADGLDLLTELSGGIEEVDFYNMKKNRVETFQFADCSNILRRPDTGYIRGKVLSIKNRVVTWDMGNIHTYAEAKVAVIVAAGVWTPEILKLAGIDKGLPQLDALYGATLEVKAKIDSSRMWEWAPYRQAVLLRRGSASFAFGDGATVKNPGWPGDERVGKANSRLLQHLNYVTQVTVAADNIMAVNEGFRPYLKKTSPPGFVHQHSPWLYSATGGAKNSTILCGHVAKTMMKKLINP